MTLSVEVEDLSDIVVDVVAMDTDESFTVVSSETEKLNVCKCSFIQC
jgi:hypothetical protein